MADPLTLTGNNDRMVGSSQPPQADGLRGQRLTLGEDGESGDSSGE